MEPESSPRPDWLPVRAWPWPLHALDVDGHRVVYTDTGGDGPALLLVHVGLWSFVWKGLIAELADRYRCITLDVPGSGLSGPAPPSLSGAAAAIGELVDRLDPPGLTLVVHDTGAWSALAAVGFRPERAERVCGLVAVNTFGWRPRGVLLLALRTFGSTPMRELTARLGLLSWGSATVFGAGRHWDRAARQVWRRGLRDRERRRFPHRIFAEVAGSRAVSDAAQRGLAALADRPTLTVFGRLGDYFGFRRRWRQLRPDLAEVTVPWGLHFPMTDDPALVARAIHAWHRERVAPSATPGQQGDRAEHPRPEPGPAPLSR